MNEEKNLLSTKEVAERLGLTVTTIYHYVKTKKLNPVYEDWTIDETMLFYQSDVEKLENQRPSGYTTSQVAEELGVHQTTIAKQIKEGKIKADKIRYRGRMTYFIQEDTLQDLKESHTKGNRKNQLFYNRKWNYYLFQSFMNDQTKELARVMRINKESGSILTDNGEQITFEELKERGFYPIRRFSEVKLINKVGYVVFRFEQPNSLHSLIYEVIELFYRYAGYKNMKVYQSNGYIHIHVKPFLLRQSSEFLSLLEEHVIEGQVTERHNGILLDSCQERLTIHMSTEQKRKIKHDAKTNGLTVDEFIVSILEKHYKQMDI